MLGSYPNPDNCCSAIAGPPCTESQPGIGKQYRSNRLELFFYVQDVVRYTNNLKPHITWLHTSILHMSWLWLFSSLSKIQKILGEGRTGNSPAPMGVRDNNGQGNWLARRQLVGLVGLPKRVSANWVCRMHKSTMELWSAQCVCRERARKATEQRLVGLRSCTKQDFSLWADGDF